MRRQLFIISIILVFSIAIISIIQYARLVESSYDTKMDYPPFWAMLIASASRGDIGSGDFGTASNQLDISQLEPGDIVMAGNAGGSYGRYTHAGLYVGLGQIVDMYLSTGVYLANAEVYQGYRWAVILRVNATKAQKDAAVTYSLRQVGAPFFILAPKNVDGLWYCSKLVWQSYLQQGINLDHFNSYWVTPDYFIYSPYTKVIDYSQGE